MAISFLRLLWFSLCVSLHGGSGVRVGYNVADTSPSPWGGRKRIEWDVRATAKGKKAELRDKAEGTRGNKNDVIIQL
jgi:hypothetical protein